MSLFDRYYVSLDVETLGPTPGAHSMISLGAAVVKYDESMRYRGMMVGTFSVNVEPLSGTVEDPDTMEFWNEHPEEYETATTLPVPATEAVNMFMRWMLDTTEGERPVFVADPAAFDFAFVKHYVTLFDTTGNAEAFPFKCLDIPSFFSALFGADYERTGDSYRPKHLVPPLEQKHEAVCDAQQQGLAFTALLHEAKGRMDSADRIGKVFAALTDGVITNDSADSDHVIDTVNGYVERRVEQEVTSRLTAVRNRPFARETIDRAVKSIIDDCNKKLDVTVPTNVSNEWGKVIRTALEKSR